jgi:hypothetical protein
VSSQTVTGYMEDVNEFRLSLGITMEDVNEFTDCHWDYLCV